jgi:hypothetical protein
MSAKRIVTVLAVTGLALMAQATSRQPVSALSAASTPAPTVPVVSADSGHDSVHVGASGAPVVVPGSTVPGSGSQSSPGGSGAQTDPNTGAPSNSSNPATTFCAGPNQVPAPCFPVAPATPAAPAPPPPTPQQLLPGAIDSATRQVPLPVPVFMMHNKVKNWALVQIPLDFRVTPGSWAPVVARADAGGVWAEVTATPRELSFDAGDPKGPIPGTICRGTSPTEPYNPDVPGACAFTYRNASSTAPGDHYHFITTFTIIWDVTWTSSVPGVGGTLPTITRTMTEPLAVAEMKALTTCTGPLPGQGGC